MTTEIIPRAAWGAQHDDGDLTLYGLAEEVAIHHTVTHADGDDPAAEREHMRYLEGIGQSRFKHGISYNVLVFPSGRAYQGVSFSRRGTHTGNNNSRVRSVCFVGNFVHDTPTPAAIATAAGIVADGRGELWRRDAPLKGHRDYKDTECPGDHLYSRLDEIAAGGRQTNNPRPAPQEDEMNEEQEARQIRIERKLTQVLNLVNDEVIDGPSGQPAKQDKLTPAQGIRRLLIEQRNFFKDVLTAIASLK